MPGLAVECWGLTKPLAASDASACHPESSARHFEKPRPGSLSISRSLEFVKLCSFFYISAARRGFDVDKSGYFEYISGFCVGY